VTFQIGSDRIGRGARCPYKSRPQGGWTNTDAAPNMNDMEHQGSCHCGNLRVQVRLTRPPSEMSIRSCTCSFCRSHGTRTVSDPEGHADLRASDWSLVERYRFGSRTADYLLCRRCGVYVGAVCETPGGRRTVINTICLTDRAAFVREAAHPDYDGETVEARLERRGLNWTPVTLLDIRDP